MVKSKVYLLGVMLYGILSVISCQNSDSAAEEVQASQIERDAAKIDKLLAEKEPSFVQKAPNIEDYKILTFEVVKNLKTNEISIQNEQVVEFYPLDKNLDYLNRTSSSSYQVDCDNGDKSWSKSCDGKLSCGRLIAKCLDEGGCATICAQQKSTERLYSSVLVTYIPAK